jgi:TRAP-type C4-dicarboxylate transport system substrate-binding protein
MKHFHLLAIISVGIAVAACDSSAKQESATVTTNSKPTGVSNDPAKQALLPQMSAVARRTMNSPNWDSLPEADKKPFLDFQDGNAERAKQHYLTLAQNEKENSGM